MINALKNFIKTASEAPLWISIIALVLGMGVVFGVLCFETWICFMLWNGCLVAACPIIMEVGYWQMMGIWILVHFLFIGDKASSGSNE